MFASDPARPSVLKPAPDCMTCGSLKRKERRCSSGHLLMGTDFSLPTAMVGKVGKKQQGLNSSVLILAGFLSVRYIRCAPIVCREHLSTCQFLTERLVSSFYLYDLQTGNSLSNSVFILTIIYSNKKGGCSLDIVTICPKFSVINFILCSFIFLAIMAISERQWNVISVFCILRRYYTINSWIRK